MKVSTISLPARQVTFGDAFSTKQEKEYCKLIEEINKVQEHENATRLVKLYTPALPSNSETDTGTGKVNSKEAKRFYEIAKVYGGATAIKFMPMGQLTDKGEYNHKQYASSYLRSSFTIGEDNIDISRLCTKDYGNILPADELEKNVKMHNDVAEFYKKRFGYLQHSMIDFQTALGWSDQQKYPINKTLKIAYDNFKNGSNNSPELLKLRSEFNSFKNQKTPVDYDDIYSRLALFPYLKDWEAKTNFFVGFDSNPDIRAQKMPEYERLKKEHADEIEFFKFKQFLGHKAIQEAKNEINSLGMDLIGDAPVCFSWPEEQVFPDAFLKDEYGRSAVIGKWGIDVINYYDLKNNENSAAAKLFKAKVAHNLSLYDGIRFDVGWSYIHPRFHFGDFNYHSIDDMGTTVTSMIEKTAKEIKGEDYNQKKIMYECDADQSDFNLWTSKDLLAKINGLAILSTVNEKNDQANIGWGTHAFLKENIGLNDDDFILGTNNHDTDGVLNCASASQKEKASEQTGGMQRTFKLRPEDGKPDGWKLLKDDDSITEHYRKYCRARFAEIDYAKNQFIMYTDLLGRNEKVDYHTGGDENKYGSLVNLDYKNRLERNYEENYHRALQGNVGYNGADVKAFSMKLSGLKDKHPELYEKARKYAAYLKHNGGIYTKEQADKSQRANIDIEKMSIDEINNLSYTG